LNLHLCLKENRISDMTNLEFILVIEKIKSPMDLCVFSFQLTSSHIIPRENHVKICSNKDHGLSLIFRQQQNLLTIYRIHWIKYFFCKAKKRRNKENWNVRMFVWWFNSTCIDAKFTNLNVGRNIIHKYNWQCQLHS
jgi:hypothetical protein